MTTTICPNCGHEFDPDPKIIHLHKHRHFSTKMMDRLRAGFDQARRDLNAAYVSTQQVAVRAFISEGHARRGLLILEELGEIERRGNKGGWFKTDRFDRSAV